MPILQAVKNIDYIGACRYTGYIAQSIRLTLECGHEQTRKASAGVPKRARCKDCEWAAELQKRQGCKSV
jgi:hypothetical protein